MSISTVRALWGWINKLSQITDSSNLLKACKDDLLPDFSSQEYCFPSEITAGFAKDILSFSGGNDSDLKHFFKLTDLLDAIWEKSSSVNEKRNELQIMLIDVALFRALTIMHSISHGRMLYQLNTCVLLDAMIIKPDREIEPCNDLISLLSEVSEKAKFCVEPLDTKIAWTVAMLNYKVHQYEVAICFFMRFIGDQSLRGSNDPRILRAKIYIGYCHEKSTNFDEAINLFENTLSELKTRGDLTADEQDIVRELHHGLGHFYNERAVFSQPVKMNDDSFGADILNARYHMEQALAEKVDYYSCYGSLFHEYGDYWTAKELFDHASELPEIRNNGELNNELSFYIAQTEASLAKKDDKKQVNQAEQQFDSFEEYCKSTYNYDGIVHARVFKIRTLLRSIAFSSRVSDTRKERTKTLERWYKELTEYTPSSYASKSIKQAYKKTIYVLKIFQTIYADPLPVWHMPDLLYYFKRYMELMPKSSLMLDDSSEDTGISTSTNLYQINLDDLYVWCVGGIWMSGEHFQSCLSPFGIKCKVLSIAGDEQGAARTRISGNGKPDLVMLIPPDKDDLGFEREIDFLISSGVSELYFVFCTNAGGKYNKRWFEEKISSSGLKHTSYPANNELDALLSSYCLRSFEILRKELLQPIPLFSLAPTHFSKSYDFQLGEKLEIIPELVPGKKEKPRDETDKLKYDNLKYVDEKYSTTWLNKALRQMKDTDGSNICATGFLAVCCPRPTPVKGMDSYIGYSVHGQIDTKGLRLPKFVKSGVFYTIKTLPSYSKDFWALEKAIREEMDPCEQDTSEECTIYNGEALLSGVDHRNIAKLCRSILSVILGKGNENNPELDKPFCCIRKADRDTSNGNCPTIYISIFILFRHLFLIRGCCTAVCRA